MNTVAEHTPTPTTRRPTWLDQVAAADQPHVHYLPAARIGAGPCAFCPPRDPARPSTADLMWCGHRGVTHRPVGPCCRLGAIAHLVAQHGRVTVVQPPESATVVAEGSP